MSTFFIYVFLCMYIINFNFHILKLNIIYIYIVRSVCALSKKFAISLPHHPGVENYSVSVNLKSKETVKQCVDAHGSGTVAGQFGDLY